MTSLDEGAETVVFSRDELLSFLEFVDRLPDGMPVAIHVRGVSLVYPAGVSQAQLAQLHNFAFHLGVDGLRAN